MLVDESPLATSTKDDLEIGSKDAGDNREKDVDECDNGQKGCAGGKGTRGRSQSQGKWKGVDHDEANIKSIRSFYENSESFPHGHLVTKNDDANHVMI